MSDAPSNETAAPKAPKSTNQWADVAAQFGAHRGAVFALGVFVFIVLFVVLGPYIWPKDPAFISSKALDIIRSRNQGPSLAHPLGTDQLGRDMLARMIWGGQVTISVGLVAMALSVLLGTLVGILAGFFRRLDGPLMRLTDLFLALPLLPLLLVMVLLFRDSLSRVFGPEGGSFVLIVSAIGVTSWMQSARVVRGEVLALKEREFVLAAYSIGAPQWRIIFRHILPNTISPIMVAATLGVANAIITESALSFLGLGFPPDFPTWGRLLSDGAAYIQQYPSRVVWPGIAISLTVLSVNYIGDGLRDALDPRARGR